MNTEYMRMYIFGTLKWIVCDYDESRRHGTNIRHKINTHRTVNSEFDRLNKHGHKVQTIETETHETDKPVNYIFYASMYLQ